MTIEKDGLGSLPDGKSPVDSGLCHDEWAVPGYCDGVREKAQETEEPLVPEVRTHIEPEPVEVAGEALAEEVIKRTVGLGGRDVCSYNANLKCEKTQRALSPSHAAVMVKGEPEWNHFTHCIKSMPPEQPSLTGRKEKTYDYG